MIEIPEATTLASQIAREFQGKRAVTVIAGHTPHGFAFYNHDTQTYPDMLNGKTLSAVNPLARLVELVFEDMHFVIGDGTTPHYLTSEDKDPDKHQFLARFEDNSGFYCTVRMYGEMSVYPLGESDNHYYLVARDKPSPLGKEFTRDYFQTIVDEAGSKTSAKALLATEQRIPGLGYGCLQDILFNAGIHPQRKLLDLGISDLDTLYSCVTEGLADMTAKQGRDVEKDLYGDPGGYRTILSSKTKDDPCPQCGSSIVRKAYLGGNIYFCPVCQPL